MFIMPPFIRRPAKRDFVKLTISSVYLAVLHHVLIGSDILYIARTYVRVKFYFCYTSAARAQSWQNPEAIRANGIFLPHRGHISPLLSDIIQASHKGFPL